MAGIYIHIPFCRQKCAYCDFYSIANTKLVERFVDALCLEIKLQQNYLDQEKIQTIYFGGGTPSILSQKHLERIINEIAKYFNIDINNEITLEANPDDLTIDYMRNLRNLHINRLSLGIQSFKDSDLKLMKRRHTAKQAIISIHEAQEVGFKNISADLIYGLPNLTLKNWEYNIEQLIKLNIQHISAYHLTIEQNTIFYKLQKSGKINLPQEEDSLNQFLLLKGKTKENGFLHYEISNFAKDGFLSLHNTNYWMNVKYLGLGPSAHSYNLTSRQWNIRNIHGYLSAIFEGKIANEQEKLTENEKYNDYVIISLRTMWGVNTEKLKIRFGEKYQNYFLSKAENYVHRNLLIKSGNNFSLTDEGIFISDNITEDFLYD